MKSLTLLAFSFWLAITAVTQNIPISGTLVPASSSIALAEDTSIKGGFQTVSNATALAAIPASRRKEGMRVYVAESGTTYRLNSDTNTWTVDLTGTDVLLNNDRRDWFYDSFTRENTTPGASLGPPEISDTSTNWIALAAYPLWPPESTHNYIQIEDGALVTPAGQTFYLCRELPYDPDTVGAVIEWVDGDNLGSTNRQQFAIAISNWESQVWTTDFIHCTASPASMTIDTGFHSPGVLEQHATKPFNGDTQKVQKNVKYRVEFQISGASAIFRLGEHTLVTSNPKVSRRRGRHLYWETYTPYGPSCSWKLKIHSVWASAGMGVPVQYAAKTGIPNIPRAQEIYWPGGTNIATIDTDGVLTDWTASDYTVYSRVSSAPDFYQYNPGISPGIWHISGESTGLNYGHGPILRMQTDWGGDRLWSLEYRMQSGGDYNEIRYAYEYQKQLDNRMFDTFCVRNVLENKGEMYLNGIYCKPEVVISSGGIDWNLDFASSRYIHIGNANVFFANGWIGGIQVLSIFNADLSDVGEDMTLIRDGIVPERLKWANNATLNSGSMTIGKCYRILSVGTPDYYFTGCAVGDTFHVTGSTTARMWKDHRDLTLTTRTINGTNTVKQVGAMIWLDADVSTPGQFVDRSSNRLHAGLYGSMRPAIPEAVRGPYILPNAGDADAEVVINSYPLTILPYSTTLTANRTVTLPDSGDRPYIGQRIRVERTGLGNYTLDVGGVVTLPVLTANSVEVYWSGSAWVLANPLSPTGVSATIDVLVSDGTTNRTVFNSGILVSNIVNFAE